MAVLIESGNHFVPTQALALLDSRIFTVREWVFDEHVVSRAIVLNRFAGTLSPYSVKPLGIDLSFDLCNVPHALRIIGNPRPVAGGGRQVGDESEVGRSRSGLLTPA